jgi:hypothetical protein
MRYSRVNYPQSDEFQKLKGGRELQDYFYDEFVDQLDAAISQMNPSPNYAV